jgi:hypothetical protein
LMNAPSPVFPFINFISIDRMHMNSLAPVDDPRPELPPNQRCDGIYASFRP